MEYCGWNLLAVLVLRGNLLGGNSWGASSLGGSTCLGDGVKEISI